MPINHGTGRMGALMEMYFLLCRRTHEKIRFHICRDTYFHMDKWQAIQRLCVSTMV